MMETNKITRQSRSDDSGPQNKQKGHSLPRSNHGNSQHATGQKRGKVADGSNDRHKQSSGNVNDAKSHSGDTRSGVAGSNANQRGSSSGTNQRRRKDPNSGEGTPQENKPYSLNGVAPPGSQGNNRTNGGSSEPGAGGERSGEPTHGSQTTVGGTAQSNGGGFHLSNKSDTNVNSFGGSLIYSGHGNAQQQVGRAGGGSRPVKDAYGGGQGEAKKKRKNSDKAQRRASNNRRGADKEDRQNNGPMFPPTDSHGGGSHPRSHSRGTVSQASQGQAGQPSAKDMTPQHQGPPQSFYDPQNYNPFAQQNSGFPMGLNGMGGMNGGGFPFGQGGGPFMGGGQQAPQVHFIAKKQQFIAQISPEQLMNGDKRPYTAQSLHNLSANAKRAGSVYANAMGGSSKQGQGSYNLANAAFTSHPTVYLGSGAKTHTQGFSFHPSGPGGQGLHKYSNSLYGEDVKPKVAGKDILHALGSSNGFSSGYNSDPYHSMMSQGLPASLTHSTRPAKTKATQNRMQAKEKEQLYDETIKMKVLNNQVKEDNVKLKTKVKILENELSRKEKTIEDLFSHNQLIQQSHQKHQSNSNQSLLPLAQTAQKYQQETFLVMSLKKQIRELKYEVLKRDEELEVLRKNIKSTRTKEFEQEIQTYHDECLRLRTIMEDVIKQGASHPIHQQNFMERLNQMQAELNHKDQQIVQLSECLDSHLKMEKAMSGHSATTGVTGGGTSLAAVKAQDSQHFDSAPSDIQVASSSSAWTQNNQGRDKSVDKKHGLGQTSQAPAKDYQKELNRARRQLREKDKELAKLKAENGQYKRESQEKIKNESQVSKDVESTVKTLKDKMKEQKGELKRREERLAESEQRIRRLEEQMKGHQDVVKAHEDSNKQLKAQLRQAKHAKQVKETNAAKESKTEGKASKDTKEEPAEVKVEKAPPIDEAITSSRADSRKPKAPKAEIALITLVAQREKLCRDDLTAMMLAGEESLRMLIRKPSDQLIDFVKANLEDEDTILAAIPRFEMPKTDFETQVLREMRVVLRESVDKIVAKSKEECMPWDEFEVLYNGLENFEYPHKDKLLEFIKYFFLDHILSEKEIILNFAAFRDHLLARRPIGASPTDKSRNDSSLRSRRKSGESGGSYGASAEEAVKRRLLAGGSEEDKFHEEERMLDVAEQCFMRIADLLHLHEKTVKQVFLKYSQPEQFKDGSVLELISPRGFLEGVREVGFDDVTEMEAACLMKVLSKPELDNAVILNEFVLIMENFGIPPFTEEEEFENDYIPDSDEEKKEDAKEIESKPEDAKNESKDEDKEKEKANLNELSDKLKKFGEQKKQKNPLVIKFDVLDENAQEILKKLARFLLERYMHPREFFGPTIKKEVIGKKKCKVEIIKLHDFYLRLKLASIRPNLSENASLNLFLAIDGDKHPGFVQVKKMIKALEAIAEGEQEIMLKEQEAKEKEEREAAEKEVSERKEKGLPEITVEELIAQKKKEREEEKEKEEEKKRKDKEEAEAMANGKPPKGPANELMKLGGKSSPKGAAKPEQKFNSLKPNAQLNTIEEDLHETQTSHYSYQIKDGEGSERDGSKHQLSTSNHLRDSNNLNHVEDSSRGKNKLSHGVSVHSGDYSGGSNSGSKKGQRIQKDIDQKDVTIKDFKEVERTSSEMMNKSERLNPGQDSLRNGSIAELDQKLESDPSEIMYKSRTDKIQKDKAATKSLIDAVPKTVGGIDEYTDDDEQYEDEFQQSQQQIANSVKRSPNKEISQILEIEDKLQDELDEEVDKKFATQMEVSKRQQLLEDDEQYDEDEFQEDGDMLKEDTIKTDKIEQIIEDDMKQYENQQHLKMKEDEKRINTMDDEYDQNIDQNQEEPDEYSYHDEETYSQQPTPKNDVGAKEVPPPESDIEEDYEF